MKHPAGKERFLMTRIQDLEIWYITPDINMVSFEFLTSVASNQASRPSSFDQDLHELVM